MVNNKEYVDQRNSGVLITVIIISVIMIVLLVLAVFLFYYFGNPPFVRQINVTNEGEQPVNVLVGAAKGTGVAFLPSRRLTKGQTHRYQATPGTNVFVQGYSDGTIITTDLNPFTTAHLVLSGVNISNAAEITDGTTTITDLVQSVQQLSYDLYGISLLNGYNLPLNIQTNSIVGSFLCGGPRWEHTINANEPNMCPLALQSPNHENYVSCLPPCNVFGTPDYCCEEPLACNLIRGCQSEWPDQSFYNVFADACPSCIITKCDNLNYQCDSQGGTSVFNLTFGKELPSN
jgi:hypothetical protein